MERQLDMKRGERKRAMDNEGEIYVSHEQPNRTPPAFGRRKITIHVQFTVHHRGDHHHRDWRVH
jgi:hypothetical protein